MERDDQSPAAHLSSSVGSPTTDPLSHKTFFPPPSPGSSPYNLPTDMSNNNHSSKGPSAGNSAGLHQHGLSSGANIADAAAIRKARFVSDSNIPSIIGMGFASSQSPSQNIPSISPYAEQQSQHQHTQSSAAAIASALGNGHGNVNTTGPSNGGIIGDLNGSSRTFSGNHVLSSGLPNPAPISVGFSPSSPNAVAYPATSPLNMANAPNSFPSSTAGSGPPFVPTSPMFQAFSPTAFSPQANFMGGVGLLSPTGGPAAPQATGRTVYVGNLPADASIDELLNLVKFGPIENVKILPEKSCAFFSFLDGATAAAFHADASVKKLSLHGQELKIGWGKPSAVPTAVMLAVQQHQATRNVYVQLGQDDGTTEEALRDSLSRFGPIDQVKIVRDKNIGFVHFLSIGTAMKVVSQLPHEPDWQDRRISYGKDRCAYVPKSQQQNQAHNNQAAAMGMAAAASLGYPTAFGLGAPPPGSGSGMMFGGNSPGHQNASPGGGNLSDGNLGPSPLQHLGNRTIYLGNIHPETTAEEICNHIRGGILQTVRYIPEKHIAFVTFVDANSALAFQHMASYSGIMIHNRRLKIGWGKHSGPLSPAIAMAVQAGASRNVYVGNIENPDVLSEEKLRRDFSEHGDVELVNSLQEKNCAFVNFCNIQNAIKAIEAMKSHVDYQNVKISHGKDRCGRQMHLGVGGVGGGGGYRKASGSASPNPPRSGSGSRSVSGRVGAGASGESSTTSGGDSLSTSSSAYDMPPIDSTRTVGASETPSGVTGALQ